MSNDDTNKGSAVTKTEITIPALDKSPLAASLYQATSSVENCTSVVIINSATGIARRFYDAYARFLATDGFLAITYDYRGIGDSRPKSLRGFEAHVRDWGELDASGVIAWAVNRFPQHRLMVVGHSIGGVLLGICKNVEALDRCIFVAPQSGYWRLFHTPYKQGWAFLWFVVAPLLTALCGYFPAKALGMGEDLPKGVVLEFGRWARDPAYLLSSVHGVPRPAFEQLQVPTLVYSIEDDVTAPPRALEEILRLFVNTPITRRHLKPQDIAMLKIGHLGFFRRTAPASLWQETSEWLQANNR